MLEGKTINAGGSEWSVPEMRTKTARKYLPYLSGEKDKPERQDELLDLLTDTVHSILLPNYPDLTRDQVEELFSPREYSLIIAAASEAANLVQRGEAVTESNAL